MNILQELYDGVIINNSRIGLITYPKNIFSFKKFRVYHHLF